MKVDLFTFDIFGTVLDWRRGLRQNVETAGHDLSDQDFNAILKAQGEDEQQAFRPYREIVARSLQKVLHMSAPKSDEIGADAGKWPLYPDSKEALARLMRKAPCVGMTNSDVSHGEQVQRQLGFRLSHWFCAEDVRVYKPSPQFWREVAKRLNLKMDATWWHVAAYGDYDLTVAKDLGLTTVLIDRPHAVEGPYDLRFANLEALAQHVEKL